MRIYACWVIFQAFIVLQKLSAEVVNVSESLNEILSGYCSQIMSGYGTVTIQIRDKLIHLKPKQSANGDKNNKCVDISTKAKKPYFTLN